MSDRKKDTTPVDGIIVCMDWYCGICKQNWKSYVDQGEVRRMPSYVKLDDGRRIQTRRPDGSMLRAHEDCARRALRVMEARENRKKKLIVSP